MSNALKQHLNHNRAAIQADAVLYAQSYNVTMEVALREVSDEYIQGFHDDAENARANGDPMTTYRVVALYFDAEIAEGYGLTLTEATEDVRSRIPDIYPSEDVTFETHREVL